MGVIETGKLADIAVVSGDPIANITELERVRFVKKDDQAIKNELENH